MKKILFIILFICLSSIYLFAEDKIVAVVNNEIITSADLDSFVKFLNVQLSAKYQGRELEDKVQSMLPDVLNRLIEDKLLVQEAKKMKITVDSNRIKARIDQMRKSYPSQEIFMQDLTRNGLTLHDIEDKIRDQIIMFDIVDARIKSKISVNPNEVTKVYNEHSNEFVEPEKRHALAVKIDDKGKADRMSSETRKGKDFKETATLLGLEVVDLGLVNKTQLRQEMDDVIFSLGVGEISSPIKVDDKFYVLKLEEVVPAKQKPLEEAKQDITNMVLEEKMQAKMVELMDELKKKSYIEIKKD